MGRPSNHLPALSSVATQPSHHSPAVSSFLVNKKETLSTSGCVSCAGALTVTLGGNIGLAAAVGLGLGHLLTHFRSRTQSPLDTVGLKISK